MALTKSDIVAKVHDLGFTKKKSVDIIETLLETIKSTLEKSDDVLNSDEASQSDELVWFDKNNKKSVMPAFFLLEKVLSRLPLI